MDDLVELHKRRRTFEYVFIDGLHLFDYVTVDFFYSRLLVSGGGWICMDEIWLPAVSIAFEFITRNLKVVSVVKQAGRYCV
jgi:hypothetical protein